MSRIKIVLTKLALMVVFTTGAFAVLVTIHLGMYAIVGFAASSVMVGYVLAFALQNLLLTIGFAAVASVVVYGTQKPTFAAVAYFMLGFSVVTMLIRAGTSLLNLDLSARLLSGTTGNIMLGLIAPGGSFAAPGIEYLGYLILAVAASIFVFKRREMEF